MGKKTSTFSQLCGLSGQAPEKENLAPDDGFASLPLRERLALRKGLQLQHGAEDTTPAKVTSSEGKFHRSMDSPPDCKTPVVDFPLKEHKALGGLTFKGRMLFHNGSAKAQNKAVRRAAHILKPDLDLESLDADLQMELERIIDESMA